VKVKHDRCRSGGAAGFSLIELMVAIIIAGIIASMVWLRLSYLAPRYRLAGAARDLMAELQKARGRAIAEGRCFQVVFSNANTTYQVNSKSGSASCGTTGYSADTLEPVQKSVGDGGAIGIEKSGSSGTDPDSVVFNPRGGVETTSTIRVFNNLGDGLLVLVNSAGRISVQ
jgi:type II secretion system protein H